MCRPMRGIRDAHTKQAQRVDEEGASAQQLQAEETVKP
jgi:hypothetical protein